MNLFRTFRQLDRDVQKLINFLLHRKTQEDGMNAPLSYWDLVVLLEVPGELNKNGQSRH